MGNWLYWLIGLMMLSAVLKVFMPVIKGWIGEKTVAVILSSLPQNEYHTLNNIMLKTNRGTTQIDHIIVSVYGIFVIETKNYKGWITGMDSSPHWTKNVYGKKYSFRNPILQNYGHVKALAALLDIPESVFIPIVVFSINSELKVKTEHPVVYTTKLKQTILKREGRILNEEEIKKIANTIMSNNVDSREIRKEHVADIHKNIKTEKESVKVGICPKCDGRLILRKGKYGTFTGCCNYPKCRYTAKY